MHFFSDGTGILPFPLCSDGSACEACPSGSGCIGSTAEEWPIWLNSELSGKVHCSNMDSEGATMLLNSSVSALAEFLVRYRQHVDEVLAWGALNGVQSAWRRRCYPMEFDRELIRDLRSLDARALDLGAYWDWHVRERGNEDGV
jgi:hypothetical protein